MADPKELRALAEPRFFIDHGMIHDRVTGKHVTTEEDSVFCDGVSACCALLNELSPPVSSSWASPALGHAHKLVEDLRTALAQHPESGIDESLRKALDAIETADCELTGMAS